MRNFFHALNLSKVKEVQSFEKCRGGGIFQNKKYEVVEHSAKEGISRITVYKTINLIKSSKPIHVRKN